MKLVLIQPPVQDFYDTAIRLQPLGLAYLKAAVKKNLPEWEVVIKDFHQGRGRRTISLPRELAYLKDYYPWPDQSPFSLFHHYYHFGASFETIAEEVAKEKPDLVGISSLFSAYYREVLTCAEVIKKNRPCPVVIGGAHASAVPELMLSHPAVDWVIRGEGERSLVELIKAWKTGQGLENVPGLGYKHHGRLILNPPGDPYPLDALPFPDFSDLAPETYRYEKRPLCFLLTSRGCPHHCSFCSVHRTFPCYQRRSIQNVLAEMIQRYQEGYRVFDFEDDNLTFNQEEFKTLCRKISQTFSPGEIECLAMNGISFSSLDGELLTLMQGAGFTHLNLSLVSSNPTVWEKTGRLQKMDQYLRVVNDGRQLGFKMVSYQILGLPDESLDSMIRTLRLNARLPVLLGASPFYLIPGTPIAERFPELTEQDIFKARLTAMAIESHGCKREELYTLLVTTRIINFLKGLRFQEDAISLEEALERARDQEKRMAVGADLLIRLLREDRLWAMTSEGLKPLLRFNSILFRQIWSELEFIQTQEGKVIRI